MTKPTTSPTTLYPRDNIASSNRRVQKSTACSPKYERRAENPRVWVHSQVVGGGSSSNRRLTNPLITILMSHARSVALPKKNQSAPLPLFLPPVPLFSKHLAISHLDWQKDHSKCREPDAARSQPQHARTVTGEIVLARKGRDNATNATQTREHPACAASIGGIEELGSRSI